MGDFCCHVEDELTGEAVPGVEVKLGDYTLMTDNSGTVGIVDLAPGDYEIKLSRPRYFDKTFNLHYIGKTVPIELKLTSEKLTGKILYSSSYPDTREIYSLDLETRAVTRMTENSSSESHPVLIGEKKIIFQSDILSKSTYNYDLFSYDLENRVIDRTIYRSPKNDQNPAADRSGNRIVFQSEGMKVFYYNLSDGSEARMIGAGQRPVIDPDGNRIAFVTTDYKKIVVTDIYGVAMGIYAGNTIQNNLDYKISNPCWSPDGSKIAFEAYIDGDGPRYIYYINLAAPGTPIVQVTYSYGPKDQQHDAPLLVG